MSFNFDAMGYYSVLEVSPNATTSQIKQQYYDRAKFWHPDHNEAPNALEIFQKISVAYNILKEQKSRLKYDLLSLIYTEKDFPEINSLKVYKNQNGRDDSALRVLKQRRVTAFFGKPKIKETKDICNFKEAKDMVINTSVANWLQGWWGNQAFIENIKALQFNISTVKANDEDNLKLMIHNSLAYDQENHKDFAWIYAKQACLMVEKGSRAQELLETYINILDFHPQKAITLPYWSEKALRFRQTIIPFFIMIIGAIIALFLFGKIGLIKLPEHKTTSYYQEIEFAGGARIADDQIDARIVKLDIDYTDTEYLYHLKNNGKIYYGPDKKFDILKEGLKGETVRLIGYTPNMKWLKIMIDNGDSGYVNKENLEKGIGNPLPARSKIYKK